MSKIRMAEEYGCLHCGSRNFSGNSEKLTCNKCGCVHTVEYYEYAVPTKEKEKIITWGDHGNTIPKL